MSLEEVRNLGVIKRAPKYMQQKLAELKEEIDNSVITVRNLSTALAAIRIFRRMDEHIKDAAEYAFPSVTRNVLHGRPLTRPQNQSQ